MVTSRALPTRSVSASSVTGVTSSCSGLVDCDHFSGPHALNLGEAHSQGLSADESGEAIRLRPASNSLDSHVELSGKRRYRITRPESGPLDRAIGQDDGERTKLRAIAESGEPEAESPALEIDVVTMRELATLLADRSGDRRNRGNGFVVEVLRRQMDDSRTILNPSGVDRARDSVE